jgi:hypothetical protein
MQQAVAEKTRRIAAILLLVLLVGAGGCGKTATVTGNVTYQGRPVTYGSVIFLNADKTARSCAIATDGSYRVEGVLPGTVSIAVISRDPAKGRSAVRGRKSTSPAKTAGASPSVPATGWFPLPSRFESPASSGLSCDVSSGLSSHDIDLK